MACNQLDTLLKNVTIEGVKSLNKELGRGAYGRVFSVEYQGVVCAAKEIHPFLIECIDSPVDKKAIIDNFVRECHQSSLIHHQNVVKFLGVYYTESNNLPVMVMELMNTNLTSFVKDNQSKIDTRTKFSVLYDVSLGLSHLHTRNPVVIHRDLTSNNVMLTNELVAKIGDLGVAKVIQANTLSRHTGRGSTKAHGTVDFMPPETLEAISKYSTAVDVFSFACIALHIFAEEWPKPCGQKRRDQITKKLLAVTEVERRQKYLDKIPESIDIFKQMLKQCLDDDSDKRPSIQKNSEVIKALKVKSLADSPTNPSRKDFTDHDYTATVDLSSLPEKLITNTDLHILKHNYAFLLRSLPETHLSTLECLQDYLTDDCICAVVESTNVSLANKMMLDCMISKLTCKEDLLDFFDQLEKINNAHNLASTVNELRQELQCMFEKDILDTYANSASESRVGVQQSIQFPISTTVTTNTQSLSTDQQHHSVSPRYKHPRPPPLPSIHVDRQDLLDEIVTKLLQATIDPNKCGVTITITGAGGFGKTTTAISLCHHPLIKKHFTDGFIFIRLGPQATDSSIKLRAIYKLLTDEQCDINVVEHKINKLTSDCYRNLLVIIDDVWHVEDAEPLVKAFSNCKIILTTRMNDISIISKQKVTIGPMTQNEAISLLTSGITSYSQLSQEDVSLLCDLAQDVNLWPLLLSLIRGQLSHNIKHCHLSCHKAIQNIQVKLHHKGLTAFDMNNFDILNKSCNLSVKACIGATLELLEKSLIDKIKTLVLWTGIGTSLQTAVLNNLWNISKREAQGTVDKLRNYGLIHFTDITISYNNATQPSLEVHAVISQYIIENMDSKEVCILSPYGELGTKSSVEEALDLLFQQSCEVHHPLSLTPVEFLKYKQSEVEDSMLPYFLKLINMYTVTDPHIVILQLQEIKQALTTSTYRTNNLLPLIDEEISSLLIDCQQILNDGHKMCRKLNQSVQRILYEKDYYKLTEIIDKFIKNYDLCSVAQKAVTMVKKITPKCDRNLEYYMTTKCGYLQMKTMDYMTITTLTLPHIKLFTELHEQITSSLLKGSPHIELTCHYIKSGKFDEKFELVGTNRLIKLQEVAPDYVYKISSQ